MSDEDRRHPLGAPGNSCPLPACGWLRVRHTCVPLGLAGAVCWGRLASLSLSLGAQEGRPSRWRGLARVGEATQTGHSSSWLRDDSEQPARLRTVARLVPKTSDLSMFSDFLFPVMRGHAHALSSSQPGLSSS